MIELVVSHFDEDLNWLRHFSGPRVRVMLYSKGAPLRPPVPVALVPLENRGREAGTFLYHIVTLYDELADVTAFLQGDPIPHHPLGCLLDDIALLARGDAPTGYVPLASGFATDDRYGQPNNWRAKLPVGELYERAFGRPGPDAYKFGCGGQFAATREAIHSKPREWWREVQTLCETEYPETYPWVIERLIGYLIRDPLTAP